MELIPSHFRCKIFLGLSNNRTIQNSIIRICNCSEAKETKHNWPRTHINWRKQWHWNDRNHFLLYPPVFPIAIANLINSKNVFFLIIFPGSSVFAGNRFSHSQSDLWCSRILPPNRNKQFYSLNIKVDYLEVEKKCFSINVLRIPCLNVCAMDCNETFRQKANG